MSNEFDELAVANFRAYLQIPSVHPNIDYVPCVEFLKTQSKSLNLPLNVYHIVPDVPIVVVTWCGTDPTLPAILLNSHMDVVPVYPEKWSHPPFGAEITPSGDIYARGAQDMKSVGVQYLEAVRRLKHNGVRLKRTLHLSFVPEEEVGGVNGMKQFVHTGEFRALNIGFSLDEGMATPDDVFPVFYAERNIWHMIIHCPGTPGHGSLLLKNTAGEKVNYLLNKFFEFRKTQVDKLASSPELSLGDVTTVNLTQMSGGVQSNVVPPELTITIDCRNSIGGNPQEWESTVLQWCREAGDDVWIEWEQKQPPVPATKLDATNPYWVAFKQAMDELNLKVVPRIFPGGTDSRFVRELGLPAIGFSPIWNTPVLLHDHDERLSRTTFLAGIGIYQKILEKVANI